MRRRASIVGVALVATLGLVGCGAEGGGTAAAAECEVAGGMGGKGTGTVTVALNEWTVRPEPVNLAGGSVRVTARNEGKEAHEVVIVRAPISQLKVVDGAVDEAALPAGAFIGEIEGFDADKTCEATFDLSPGTYSFFCNIVETEPDGTRESHFEQGMVSEVSVAENSSATPTTAGGATSSVEYRPVSDVNAHAAIGGDIARIKELLAPAKDGGTVDWTAVRALWERGGSSKRSDGSNRTLQKLVDDAPGVSFVDDAISGSGSAQGASDAVRAQRVDKGISVLLARKVIDELDAAAEKTIAGKTAAGDGAPHNVDEAWAFFTANGHGVASTAEKRAVDFKREGRVVEPIVTALAQAQTAAGKGDGVGLANAVDQVRQGLDYIFYLATHKYLGAKDEVGRAEGAAFYRGVQPRVAAADTAADNAIVAAFASGDTASGQAALHGHAVLEALGVAPADRVDGR